MKRIWINRQGSLRMGWKLLAVFAASMVLNFVVNGLLSLKVNDRTLFGQNGFTDSLKAPSLYFAIVVVFAVAIMEKWSLSSIGLTNPLTGWGKGAAGIVSGGVSCLIVILLLGMLGYAVFPDGLLGADWHRLNVAAIFTSSLFPAIGEELLFRGYGLKLMTGSFGRNGAIVASSLLFSLMHGANTGVTALAFLNIGLIGLVFALVAVRSGSLWFPIGFHFAWNFVQGSLFSGAVSGGGGGGLIPVNDVGKSWLSGGAFGIEGSIWATPILALLVVIAAGWRFKETAGGWNSSGLSA